jgi:hypothetical protein
MFEGVIPTYGVGIVCSRGSITGGRVDVGSCSRVADSNIYDDAFCGAENAYVSPKVALA